MDNYKTLSTSTPIHLVDYPEATQLLRIKPQSLRRMVSQKRVPHLHVGRLVRFDVADLEAWLASNKTQVTVPQRGEP